MKGTMPVRSNKCANRIMETATLWHKVLEDPQLQELPYKIETNERGQIILSPHKPQHGFLQSQISDLLRDHASRAGRRAVEFAIETKRGIKVPDVIWISDERIGKMPDEAEASPVVPEIVVEVLSEGNTDREIAEKRTLYLDEGGREVWTCAPDGTIRFYDASGQRDRSALVPEFPKQVD